MSKKLYTLVSRKKGEKEYSQDYMTESVAVTKTYDLSRIKHLVKVCNDIYPGYEYAGVEIKDGLIDFKNIIKVKE